MLSGWSWCSSLLCLCPLSLDEVVLMPSAELSQLLLDEKLPREQDFQPARLRETSHMRDNVKAMHTPQSRTRMMLQSRKSKLV